MLFVSTTYFFPFWTVLNKVTLIPSASAAGPLLLCSRPAAAGASLFTAGGVSRDLTILTGAKSGLCIGENEEEEEEDAVLEIRTSDKSTETFAGGTIVVVVSRQNKIPRSPELDTERRIGTISLGRSRDISALVIEVTRAHWYIFIQSKAF